jgi:hypothetical protein
MVASTARHAPQYVIPRIPILGRPGSCGLDQLEAERNRDPVRNLVLQGELVPGIAVEPLRP